MQNYNFIRNKNIKSLKLTHVLGAIGGQRTIFSQGVRQILMKEVIFEWVLNDA